MPMNSQIGADSSSPATMQDIDLRIMIASPSQGRRSPLRDANRAVRAALSHGGGTGGLRPRRQHPFARLGDPYPRHLDGAILIVDALITGRH